MKVLFLGEYSGAFLEICKGLNKLGIETYRISEADRNAINSILLLKKKNVTDSSSFYLLTGGNEQKLKVYV